MCWIAQYLKGQVEFNRCFKRAIIIIVLLSAAQLTLVYQLYAQISIDPEATLKELLLGISLTLFFALSLLLLNSRSRIKATIYTIVLSGVFQAIFGSLMTLSELEYLFFIKKDSYIGMATGTFVNRNHLAGYLVICLSLGLGLMIAKLRGNSGNFKELIRNTFTAILGNKALLRISLIIMVAALVMTHSRMGNTSFFVSMGIIGTLAVLLKKRSVKATLILLISLLIIDITVVGTFFGVDKVLNRLEATSVDKESRDEVNLYSLKISDANLLLGTGAGSFYTAFPQVREQEVGFLFYDHAHNDYLEFLTERGIIGMMPLILVVLITFGVAFKALRKRHNPLMRGCAFGCLMSMLAMALHASVDFNLQIPANAMTFMLVLALGWIGAYYKRGVRKFES
ncbi:MAG: hypothetical protein OFPII_43650 [Osedax symbiont Rs1]|nr:MAG: hypothetical protein OFPII_43650 [Osedax symbiont Rs1]